MLSTTLCRLMVGWVVSYVLPTKYGSGAVVMELLALDVGKNMMVVVVLRSNNCISFCFCASLTHQLHVTGLYLLKLAHLFAHHCLYKARLRDCYKSCKGART